MIIMIAAVGKNRELGAKNQLLWHIREDLQFFKEMTVGHTIVMGRNTFFSLPKVLPNRKHLVLTSKNDIFPAEVVLCKTVDEILAYSGTEDLYIIGGAQIYGTFYPHADVMYLTEIDKTYEDADVFFPIFDQTNWTKTVLGIYEENGISYSRIKYERE